MNLHANHRTCPSSRRLICRRVLEEGWTMQQAAEAAGCSARTAAKWVGRFRAGEELVDRSSRPRRSPGRLPQAKVEAIERLRRLRLTAAEISEVLALPLSTVSLWLKRIGLGKRSRLEPREPPNRYERRHPGELVHVDIKQLGRIRGIGHRISGSRASQKRTPQQGRLTGVAGWEYLHVIVDDHSRLAYAEVLGALDTVAAAGFLRRAIAWYAARGIRVRAVIATTAPPIPATFTRARCASSACVTCGSHRAGHAPTARPSASSRHCSTNGPTTAPTAAHTNAPPPTPTAATSIDLTAASATNHRPHG